MTRVTPNQVANGIPSHVRNGPSSKPCGVAENFEHSSSKSPNLKKISDHCFDAPGQEEVITTLAGPNCVKMMSRSQRRVERCLEHAQ